MKKILTTLIVVFLLLFPMSISASDYIELESKDNVAIDKDWTITFNVPLDPETVTKESVYVKNMYNRTKFSSFTVSDDAKSIHFKAPSNDWYHGMVHTLYIEDSIASSDGTPIKSGYKMDFTTKHHDAVGTSDVKDSTGYLLLKENGDVFTFDHPFDGRVTLKPTNIKGIKEIGYAHSMYDSYFLLDNEGQIYHFTPELRKFVPFELSNIETMSTDGDQSLAIDKDGFIWTWETIDGHEEGYFDYGLDPQKVADFVHPRDILSTSRNQVIVDSNGDVWIRGYNRKGQFGTGETTEKKLTTFQKIDGLKNVLNVEESNGAHDNFFSALTENGDVYVWGDSQNTNTTKSTTVEKIIPITRTPFENITHIQASHRMTQNNLFVVHDDRGRSWYYNSSNFDEPDLLPAFGFKGVIMEEFYTVNGDVYAFKGREYIPYMIPVEN